MKSDTFRDIEKYISAIEASKKTGYTSDYIGQLCRRGKIPCKLTGHTWYVDLFALINHKQNRRLGRRKTESFFKEKPRYEADNGPVLPPLSQRELVASKLSSKHPARRVLVLALYLSCVFGATSLMYLSEMNHGLSLVALPSLGSIAEPFNALASSFTIIGGESLEVLGGMAALPHLEGVLGEELKALGETFKFYKEAVFVLIHDIGAN